MRRIVALRPLGLLALLVLLSAATQTLTARAQPSGTLRLLVFSKTAEFRHDSIPAGLEALRALGRDHGWTIEATEDASVFEDAQLAHFDVVVFLSTTGDVLDETQQSALQRFVRGGHGFVGIHAAADTEHGWPWYGELVGAWFVSHPDVQPAEVRYVDPAHPATRDLPRRLRRRDEWYDFDHNPRGQVHVLAQVTERTYTGGAMGTDHPLSWCHVFDGGRAFYTAQGHTAESFVEPELRDHLAYGIEYAGGRAEGDCRASLPDQLVREPLETEIAQPMGLAVAPDGRVFFIERAGRVRLYHPDTRRTTIAASLDVDADREDGLLGIALDPQFATNHFVYLYYSPRSPSVNRLARFELRGDALDPSTARTLLDIPTDRAQCCHSAGHLAFDNAGNLLLSTGDNTNPFESDGFAPLDERSGRTSYDAQRTSANTSDLRGKVLRITPTPDGNYTIPSGNLFPPERGGGRPEIYAMGLRNPFRFAVDARGSVWIGDVGPDARVGVSSRGPAGYDEINVLTHAANLGWPYCIGASFPYRDFDFATRTSGAAFDCNALRNDSPNNTGARMLPPAQRSWFQYSYDPNPELPQLDGQGRAAMVGPFYHRPDAAGQGALPAYYEGAFLFYDWARSIVLAVWLDDEGQMLDAQRFAGAMPLNHPVDFAYGPDGVLYVLEYGTADAADSDAAWLSSITYSGGERRPHAELHASPVAGRAPLVVSFSAEGSDDAHGLALEYDWDFDSDGTIDAHGVTTSHTYETAGEMTAELTVRNAAGEGSTRHQTIVVGNEPPQIALELPPEGGFVEWGEWIPYRVTVTDAEDGTTAQCDVCERVAVTPAVGHETHKHDGVTQRGCVGAVQIDAAEHAGRDVLAVLTASYTDRGAGSVPTLTERVQVKLHPKRLEAEFANASSGVIWLPTPDAQGGGQHAGYLEHGDWIRFDGLDLRNITRVRFRVASESLGGRIEVHADAPTGPLLANVEVVVTRSWNNYVEVTGPITDPGGRHDLYFVFLREPGPQPLFDVNWLRMEGPGLSVRERPTFDPDGGVCARPETPGSDGGCGCRVAGSRGALPAGLLGVGLAVWVAWKRRRSRYLRSTTSRG